MSESIFSPAVRVRPPNTQNPRGHEFRSLPESKSSRIVARPPSKDASWIAIIEAPLEPGETAMVGFARKEAELRNSFAALSVMESRSLHARLANPRSGDTLVAAFMRMTADRRARLINFLSDARRREALNAGR